MALDVTAVRKGIAASAANAAGLQSVKHYAPDGEHGSPAFWVEVDSIESNVLGNRTRWSLILRGRLYVSGVWDRSAQETTDELVDLIWVAIEADQTVAGEAQAVAVQRVDYLLPDETSAVGATFTIEVEV